MFNTGREGTPVLTAVNEDGTTPSGSSLLDEMVRDGARRMPAAALEVEVRPVGAKFPKAVKKITDDRERLSAFYDFPAERWIHLRTTNPSERGRLVERPEAVAA